MIVRKVVAAAALVLVAGIVAGAQGLSPSEQRGQAFMLTNCSRCHAIGKAGDSPLAIAPPFRTLHTRYPVDSLQEALVEGIMTGHPTMPEFRLDPGEARDVISYLKTLEK